MRTHVTPVQLLEGGLLATSPPPIASSAQSTSGAAPSVDVGGGLSRATLGPDARGCERHRLCHQLAQPSNGRRSPNWGAGRAGVSAVGLSRESPGVLSSGTSLSVSFQKPAGASLHRRLPLTGSALSSQRAELEQSPLTGVHQCCCFQAVEKPGADWSASMPC